MKKNLSKILLQIFFTLIIFLLFGQLVIGINHVSAVSRPMKYYLVDRVRSNSDFSWLAARGINTAIVDFKVGPQPDPPANWDSIVNAAAAAGIKIVIWPDGHQGSDVSGCRWETPFDDSSIGNGTDYLLNIRAILNRYGNNPNVIGIVTAHEPVWVTTGDQDRCSENIADMTTIKTQIKDYLSNTVHRDPSYEPFKVWNYIDNIYNMSNLSGYSSANKKAQILGIMDVAVIWQHCAQYPKFNGDGSACLGTSQYTAQGGINYDRNLLKNNALEGVVEEVFIIQTFHQGTTGDYAGKYTLAELETFSKNFIDTNGLDGFGYYTWDEGWYDGNLKKYSDLQPAIASIDAYIKGAVSPSPSPSAKPGDANGDGKTDGIDYVVWLNHYNQTITGGSTIGDFNNSGSVDGVDYVIWLNNYGK